MPNPRFSILARAVLAAVTGLTAWGATALWQIAQAQAATGQPASTRHYDLPAAALADALSRFARVADITLSFEPALVAGQYAPALRGNYEIETALRLLTSQSQVEAVSTGGRGYYLRARPTEMSHTLEAVTVQGAMNADMTENTQSYAAPVVSMGRGTQWREVPQSITVLTQQRIEDQGIETLDQALTATPGIVVKRDYYNNPNVFYSRGFAMNQIQVDGVALGGYSAEYYAHNMAMYDHVEVLRGADGLFSGTGLPGGAVNLVRKRPLDERQILFTTSAGSWDRYRSELDLTGPLAFDGKLKGRLVGAWSDEQSFQDVVRAKDKFIYGVLEADLTPATRLQAGFSPDEQRNTHWPFGLPRHGDGSVIDVPRSRTTAARWNRWDRDTTEFFVKAEHAFSQDWRVAASFMHLESDGGVRGISHLGSATPDGYLGIRTESYDFSTRRKSWDVNLQGAFDWLGGRHRVLLGADAQTVKNGSTTLDLLWNGQAPNDVLNIFRNEFAGYPAPDEERDLSYSDAVTKERGIYARVNLQLAEPWHVILGSRWSRFEYESLAVGTPAMWIANYRSESAYEDKHIWTPYVGMTLDLNDNWTAYASLTEIYQSQANRLGATGVDPFNNSPLNPIEGRNVEVGAKAEYLDGKLTASMALYHTTRKGEAVSDPAFSHLSGNQLPPSCCFVENGDIVSKGFELELAGEVLPGWQVSAGYTYNHNKNKNSQAAYNTVMPKHLFKLWSSYRLQGRLQGLTLGGGVNIQSRHYVGSRIRTFDPWTQTWAATGNIPHNYVQGGYAVWDVFARYELTPHWSLQLNVNNVFDKHYFQFLSDVDRGNIYGEPRSYTLTLRGRF